VSGADDPVLEHQLSMNRETWKALEEHGVREGAELSLDFFFVAPGEEAARALATYIGAETDYEAEASSVKTGWLSKPHWGVSGSTPPTAVSPDVLDEWVTWMVAAGQAHGCEFDGWGAAVPDA